jgi:hypothetical protein
MGKKKRFHRAKSLKNTALDIAVVSYFLETTVVVSELLLLEIAVGQ